MKQNAIINRYTLQTITLKTQTLAITTFFTRKQVQNINKKKNSAKVH